MSSAERLGVLWRHWRADYLKHVDSIIGSAQFDAIPTFDLVEDEIPVPYSVGLYLIFEERFDDDDEWDFPTLRYVGRSKNLHRRISEHLFDGDYRWEEGFSVFWLEGVDAYLGEADFILVGQPTDNVQHTGFVWTGNSR